MEEQQWQKVYAIVADIEKTYSHREGSQSDVANEINEKYGTCLTTEDIADVTQQLGYSHTILRTDEKPRIIFLNETFRSHMKWHRL